MTQARAVTDGETVLATIDVEVTPQRAFAALNSAEVEQWWGVPGLYRFASGRAIRELRILPPNRAARCLMDRITIEAGDDVAAIIKAFGAQLPNPANSLSLLARSMVRDSDRDTVKSAFRRARCRTLDEPGCRAFELNEDPQNPGGFFVDERWRSLADLEAHLRKDHAAELRTLSHRLIVDGPEFQVLFPAE